MADCFLKMGAGGGVSSDETTVTKDQVLSEKKYLGADTDDEVGIGTMPNNGSKSAELSCGGSFDIVKGYHDGTGKVTAKSLKDQTSATAAAGDILNTKTAFVNGAKVTGTMPNRGTYYGGGNSNGNDASTKRFWVAIPNGHYDNDARVLLSWQNVKTLIGITADKIKKGVTIMDLIGSYEGFPASTYDIYNRGTWGSGWSSSRITVGKNSNDNTDFTYDPKIAFEKTSIKIDHYMYGSGESDKQKFNNTETYIQIGSASNPINFSQYNSIKIVVSNMYSYRYTNDDGVSSPNMTAIAFGTSGNTLVSVSYSDNNKSSAETTITLNLSNINSVGFIRVMLIAYYYGWLYSIPEISRTAYVHRIYGT